VLVQIGGYEITECPVLHLDPEDEHAVELHRAGYLASIPVAERVHVPARLFEAMILLASMKGAADGN
jgi:hypothetical protein